MTSVRGILGAAAITLATTALGGDLEVFKAEEVKPVQAQPPKMAPRSGEPEVFHAEEAKLLATPGVDPVASAGPLDPKLAGSWRLLIPSSSYTTRTYDGPNTVDTTRSGVGASMGTLKIDARGGYRWVKNGQQLSRGQLEEVVPRQGADANARYFRVKNEREEFYVTVAGGQLVLYSVGSNSFVANGTR